MGRQQAHFGNHLQGARFGKARRTIDEFEVFGQILMLLHQRDGLRLELRIAALEKADVYADVTLRLVRVLASTRSGMQA